MAAEEEAEEGGELVAEVVSQAYGSRCDLEIKGHLVEAVAQAEDEGQCEISRSLE